MKAPTNTPAEFFFELAAKDERVAFEAVEGVSTEVALKNILQEGENPFKYRLPSLPKTGNIVLKNGQARTDSKLIQWLKTNVNPEANTPTDKSKMALQLKDAKGKLLLEWTLFNAYPDKLNMSPGKSRSREATIADLKLEYSFYTLSRK